jgi:hypothetical protein
MVNPWDNPAEGPPLDTIVEAECCGQRFFARFLPERDKYIVFLTMKKAQEGKGARGDFADGGTHLPEYWRPARMPRTMTMLEEIKDAHRLEKAKATFASDAYEEAHLWFERTMGRPMRDGEFVSVTYTDGTPEFHLGENPSGEVVKFIKR